MPDKPNTCRSCGSILPSSRLPPSSVLAFCYNGFFGIASRPIPLIPVDLPTPDENFFEQDEFLHSQLENANSEYRRLLDHMRDCRWTGGFSFLNSERCSELWLELHEVTLSGIAEMGDHRLCEIYDLW